ncbi:MAG: homoserine dehydrogenase [Actinomycetota bacterium]|nr:homoserine dehydrogenase [Actinomycetota bacterium]
MEASGTDERVVRVGLLGAGTVGSGVWRILHEHADSIATRTGARIEVTRVAVRDRSRPRDVAIPDHVLGDDAMAVVEADDVDLVVEVMGGREPAGTLIRRALELRKPVVTANKELIAHEGPALTAMARAAGVDLAFEAAVAGGIPIIRPLRASLAGDRVTRVVGILNGTTNYILTRMTEAGEDFADVLADAQAAGYAEADPSADVDGHDAAAKTAILATLAFDVAVHADDVYREGIRGVSAADLRVAQRLGYVIKLIGVANVVDGRVGVRVHPAMLPADHPLASVRGVFNAVYVEADATGPLMFYGKGAGAMPTGAAVVGDVIDAARGLVHTTTRPSDVHVGPADLRPIEELRTQYCVRLEVDDRPGVLAEVARSFGAHDVSIAQVWQDGVADGAELVLVTHRSREADLRATVDALERVDSVRRVAGVIRVESEAFSA